MQVVGSFVRQGRWFVGSVLLASIALGMCLGTTPAGAHTILQRSDPANNAVLSAAPAAVRLWFSAVLDRAFSTAIVESSTFTYVNARDAQLVSGDERELAIPLAPHLSPGIYAVVWRVSSDPDGYVLSGSLLFAIARADGSVPGQPMQVDVLQAQRSSAQFQTLTLFARSLWALAALDLICWMGLSLWLLVRRPAKPDVQRQVDCARKRPLPRLRRMLGWGALVGVVVVLSLALLQRVESSAPVSGDASPPTVHLQWRGYGVLSAFHATLLTTDQQYRLVLDVTSDASGRSRVTVTVADVATGKPASSGGVSLRTTMLDMPMGDTLLTMRPEGKGRFGESLDLSMGGLWQMAIQLSTADHRRHEATVKLLTAY